MFPTHKCKAICYAITMLCIGYKGYFLFSVSCPKSLGLPQIQINSKESDNMMKPKKKFYYLKDIFVVCVFILSLFFCIQDYLAKDTSEILFDSFSKIMTQIVLITISFLGAIELLYTIGFTPFVPNFIIDRKEKKYNELVRVHID